MSLFYFLQDSQPWLQVDEQDGHEHVEQPQDAHLAAQVQVPLAQPQLESQEQAMMGCRCCWKWFGPTNSTWAKYQFCKKFPSAVRKITFREI